MDKKYEILKEDSIEFNCRTLYRIRALKDFINKVVFKNNKIIMCEGVKMGDLGGYVQSEENLSQEGKCWVADNAYVYDNANVSNNARVGGHARIGGSTRISQNAKIDYKANLYGDIWICGETHICGNADIRGRIVISDNSQISGNVIIHDMYDYLYLPPSTLDYFLGLSFYRCKDGIWVSGKYPKGFSEEHFTGNLEEFIKKLNITVTLTLLKIV